MTAPPQIVGRGKPKTTPSTTSPAIGPTDKSKKEGNPRKPQNPHNAAVKLKVVVRGLPSNLPESIFKDTTKDWINETTVDWYYYVSGKLHERYTAEFSTFLIVVGINRMSDLVRMLNSNPWTHSSLSTKLLTVTSSQTQKVSSTPS